LVSFTTFLVHAISFPFKNLYGKKYSNLSATALVYLFAPQRFCAGVLFSRCLAECKYIVTNEVIAVKLFLK
jgi:hypothetical protein